MEKIYSKSKTIKDMAYPYCPGCSHGTAQNLIVNAIDELEIRERIIGCFPIGCSGLSIDNFEFDTIGCSHGRAPAVATGLNRVRPDNIVFTYQGDGDLASIGMAETIHAANRGENMITFFANNGIYGMTGGQMAPTTLVGQKATTCTEGRNPDNVGFPFRMAEIISQLEAPVYVARFALNSPKNILLAQKGIKKAFEIQKEGKGYVFIELLQMCPTNWGLSPLESVDWLEQRTMEYYPLGEFRNLVDGGEK